MRAGEVIEVMQEIAPLRYAAAWDRVGLLVGSAERDVGGGVLLAIDLTESVLAEALDAGTGLVVAYHPVIFEPLAAVTDATPRGRIVLGAARAGVAVYCPHTALDAAPGGICDWLAAALGPGTSGPLEPHASLPESQQCKLVTFAPPGVADRLREALAASGAGRIGDYTLCSFEIPGTGTFLGGAATSPAVGRAGRLERVEEVRLEMVCSEACLGAAVEALRRAHPYEEPAFEIYRLAARPERGAGQGRIVALDEPCPLGELLAHVKRRLGLERLRVAEGHAAPRLFGKVGLCPGAGASLVPAAAAARCDLYLTGEMRHHDLLAATAGGLTVVLAGHTNTERPYLEVLRGRLAEQLPGTTVRVSRSDACPWREA